MRNSGYSAEIHRVADSDKKLALFLGLAFLFVWVVTINIGVAELTPRWFQRQFDWLASDQIPPIFLSMAFASLIAAAALWLFNGNGEKLFEINAEGVKVEGMFGTRNYGWSDFELLERQVSTIILHVDPAVRGKFGPSKVCFDVSRIDCAGPRLESLIVYYRPDLYRTLQVARHDAPKNLNAAAVAPVAAAQHPEPKSEPKSSPLAQRMARLR